MSNKAIRARERREEICWILTHKPRALSEDAIRRYVSGTRAVVRQDLEFLSKKGWVELEWFIHWDGEEERVRYLIRATDALRTKIAKASSAAPAKTPAGQPSPGS
jgi:hypothetical protein